MLYVFVEKINRCKSLIIFKDSNELKNNMIKKNDQIRQRRDRAIKFQSILQRSNDDIM